MWSCMKMLLRVIIRPALHEHPRPQQSWCNKTYVFAAFFISGISGFNLVALRACVYYW